MGNATPWLLFATIATLLQLGCPLPLIHIEPQLDYQIKNITKLNQGLVFAKEQNPFTLSGDIWRLVSDHQISDYPQILASLSNAMKSLESSIQNLQFEFPSETKKHIRQDIIETSQINIQLKRVLTVELTRISKCAQEVHMLLSNMQHSMSTNLHPSRTRRRVSSFLPIAGDTLQLLFGVSTNRDIENLNNVIARQGNQTKQVIHLLAEQSTVVNNTAQAVRINNAQIQTVTNATKQIYGELKAFRTQTKNDVEFLGNRLLNLMIITNSFRMLENVLSDIRFHLTQFMAAWESASNQKLNPYFFSTSPASTSP